MAGPRRPVSAPSRPASLVGLAARRRPSSLVLLPLRDRHQPGHRPPSLLVAGGRWPAAWSAGRGPPSVVAVARRRSLQPGLHPAVRRRSRSDAGEDWVALGVFLLVAGPSWALLVAREADRRRAAEQREAEVRGALRAAAGRCTTSGPVLSERGGPRRGARAGRRAARPCCGRCRTTCARRWPPSGRSPPTCATASSTTSRPASSC